MAGRSHIYVGKHRIGRFRFLLLAILSLIGLRPFLDGLVGVSLLADAFFACVLISGIYALSDSNTHFRVAVVLAGAIVLLRVAHYAIKLQILDILDSGLSALFLIQMLVIIWTHIQATKEVTGDLIMGAACAFLLLGLIWAHGYYLLELARNGSFRGAEDLGNDLWNFIYYSFVTLTTLGYGDITAASKPARALSVLEAITGQLYLAIMIARLVGLHAAQIRLERD